MPKKGEHKCHAIGCDVVVAPRLLMCFKHWSMVPKYLQDLVYKWYVPGQEITKTPSQQYLRFAEKAIESVEKQTR